MAALRVWLLGVLAVAIWLLASYATPHPVVLGADAGADRFSAARAEVLLSAFLGSGKPRPAGSAENLAAHARLIAYLQHQNIPAQTLTGMSCSRGRGGTVCATVSDIVADAVPGSGKAIVLMAHVDSVAAGPGAADDAAGVATVLETIRALKAQTGLRRPVIILFTDGEELGLLGARLFLRNPAWASRVGAVINVEARGDQGPSYLFQTSAGDEKLIDLYAAEAPHPATSSLYSEIYRFLPNDTDLTPFLRGGHAGANFAFIGNVAAYHTRLDRQDGLDPVSLQSQGDNVLAMALGLEDSNPRAGNFSALKSGNAIYFDLFHLWLPRLPQFLALPLALLAFIAIAFSGWRNRQRFTAKAGLAALLMPPLLLLGALAMGFVLEEGAVLIAGDAPFAHPAALRIALALGVWAISLLAMRGAGAIASWLWLAGLGILSAVFLPGLSPYFIFPCLIAAALLLLTMFMAKDGFGRGVALLLSALAMAVVWIGFAAYGEAIMGIAAHPLFTIPCAMAMIALLPLMAACKPGEGAWRISFYGALLVAFGAALVAGFEPSFSPDQPERLNLRYVEKDGKTWWLADPVARLPPQMRAVAGFSGAPEVLAAWRGYVAPGGIVQLPSPTASVSRAGNSVTLDLHGSPSADGMLLVVPAALTAITVDNVQGAALTGPATIACLTRDCATAHIVLDFKGSVPKSLLLIEQRYGLPADAAFLLKARPDWAAPSGQGDVSYAAEDVMLPGN